MTTDQAVPTTPTARDQAVAAVDAYAEQASQQAVTTAVAPVLVERDDARRALMAADAAARDLAARAATMASQLRATEQTLATSTADLATAKARIDALLKLLPAPKQVGMPARAALLPTSFFPKPIPADAPLAVAGASGAPGWLASRHDSAVIVAELGKQIIGPDPRAPRQIACNIRQFGLSYYHADQDPAGPDPRVNVLYNRDGNRVLPRGWAEITTGVPVPVGAQPSAGTDNSFTVYDPVNGYLYEFWRFRWDDVQQSWAAAAVGRTLAKTCPGWYANGGGAGAAGLVAGGSVTVADVRSGAIEHRLTIAIPNPAAWNLVSKPAQRSDGTPGNTNPISEGQTFRVRPDVTDAMIDARMPYKIGRMIAKGCRGWGWTVSDKSGGWVGIGFERGSATALEDAWPGLREGVPEYDLMRGFDPDWLDALARDYNP